MWHARLHLGRVIVGGIAVIAGLVALALFLRNRNQPTIQTFGADGRLPVHTDVTEEPTMATAVHPPYGGVGDNVAVFGATPLTMRFATGTQSGFSIHHAVDYPVVAIPAYPVHPPLPGAAWGDPRLYQDVRPYGTAAYNPRGQESCSVAATALPD